MCTRVVTVSADMAESPWPAGSSAALWKEGAPRGMQNAQKCGQLGDIDDDLDIWIQTVTSEVDVPYCVFLHMSVDVLPHPIVVNLTGQFRLLEADVLSTRFHSMK